MHMIPLQFKLSEELVIKAAVLNASRFEIYYVVLAVLVAVSTAAFMLVGEQTWMWHRVALQIGLTLAGSLAITGVLLAIMRFIVFPLHARKNFRQQKALAQDMALSWTDKEFVLETGKSQTLMPFVDLYGVRASGEIVLLYITSNLYHLVPVVAFGNQGQLEAFLRKIHEAGVSRL